MVNNPPAKAGDMGLIPGSGRSPGEGKGNPLQYSCLGNPMGRKPGGLQSRGSQRVGHNLRVYFYFLLDGEGKETPIICNRRLKNPLLAYFSPNSPLFSFQLVLVTTGEVCTHRPLGNTSSGGD